MYFSYFLSILADGCETTKDSTNYSTDVEEANTLCPHFRECGTILIFRFCAEFAHTTLSIDGDSPAVGETTERRTETRAIDDFFRPKSGPMR